MDGWQKGAITGSVLGLVLSIVLIVISLGLYNPYSNIGPIPGEIVYFAVYLIFGAVIGGIIGHVITTYKKRDRKVSIKFPLAGFVIIYLIAYLADVIQIYIEYGWFHPNVFRTAILSPFLILFSPIPVIGLILGYLIGLIIQKNK